MKILVSLGLATALMAATPAIAGPAGTGLTFTEEVAKKRLEKERSAQPQAAADCAAPKAGEPDKADAKPETCRAS